MYGLWVASERYMDRSKYRDSLLHPLRKEIAKFTEFYVNSRQVVMSSLDKAEPTKVEMSGIQLEIDQSEGKDDVPF